MAFFLDEWKVSFLVPIFKAGSKNDVKNYRGICKLSAIPKLFESIVKCKLEFFIKEHISVSQHGFVSGRSTATNLVYFTSSVLNSFERGCQVDTVYTDFSKAFDSVNHNVLIHKLKCFGFHSSMLRWISSFLRNRVQLVKLDSIHSNPFHCCSGVPQGSHLGPLLFIMFINDITSVLSYSQCLLYADDLKLFLSISSINDCIKLQSDIDALSIWCKVNCLHLNIAKCNVTTFSRSSNPIIHRYSIDSLYLTRVNKVKDLGVVFDQALTFCDHVDYITSKANSMVGFIKRNTVEFSNPHSLITLFSALARSLLEYCDIVWCPFYQVHIDRVERVQRRFSKFVFFQNALEFFAGL